VFESVQPNFQELILFQKKCLPFLTPWAIERRMSVASKSLIKVVEAVENHLATEKRLLPFTKTLFLMLLNLIKALAQKIGVNSKNSSTPPSQDPRRKRGTSADPNKPKRRPGGQKGREGAFLEKVEDPDEVKYIHLDRAELPKGNYRSVGYDVRQVIDLKISRHVLELRAERLESSSGEIFVAPFPASAPKPVQYGPDLKAQTVYLSQFQIIPYDRLRGYFADQCGIPISAGSLFNFNKTAYSLLEKVEQAIKSRLRSAMLLHADETGININGKLHWMHVVCSEKFAAFFPHAKRGDLAMQEMDILPHFRGTLCHDHWKAYFKLDCDHALCNAHHLRELQAVIENDGLEWAQQMRELLVMGNTMVRDGQGTVKKVDLNLFLESYSEILRRGEIQCPLREDRDPDRRRGRIAQSTARNLLQRLIDLGVAPLRRRSFDHPQVNARFS
jgi:transposase